MATGQKDRRLFSLLVISPQHYRIEAADARCLLDVLHVLFLGRTGKACVRNAHLRAVTVSAGHNNRGGDSVIFPCKNALLCQIRTTYQSNPQLRVDIKQVYSFCLTPTSIVQDALAFVRKEAFLFTCAVIGCRINKILRPRHFQLEYREISHCPFDFTASTTFVYLPIPHDHPREQFSAENLLVGHQSRGIYICNTEFSVISRQIVSHRVILRDLLTTEHGS